tara:strand:+ start:864 stop:1136 length:273 start_codon:yes stop_codon:yes gene_type:complete
VCTGSDGPYRREELGSLVKAKGEDERGYCTVEKRDDDEHTDREVVWKATRDKSMELEDSILKKCERMALPTSLVQEEVADNVEECLKYYL